MATVKRMVCLANSRKLAGRCIAGKEIVGGQPGGWMRPVSNRLNEEVSEYERQYQDGSDPRVLDIIDVPLLRPRPKGYQRENWLLEPGYYWVRTGRARWMDLPALTDPVAPLWTNGHHTFHGVNDKIPLALAGGLTSSLRLLHVPRLAVSVFAPSKAFGDNKRRVQGRFWHDRTEYRLWVTDPVYEMRFLAGEDGDYEIGESFLTVSLGEPFKQACHKLIAAIMQATDGGHP